MIFKLIFVHRLKPFLLGFIIFFLLGYTYGAPNQASDDSVFYIKMTKVRNFMEIDRTTVTEVWTDMDKSCTLINQMKKIVRKDLGLIYSVNLQEETYSIDSIQSKSAQRPSKSDLDFKYIGQDYNPVYEWEKPHLIKKDTLANYSCDHYSCIGDADFDQISLDYFLTKTKDESMAEAVNSLMLNSINSPNKREPLIQVINDDKNILILKIIEKVENPISPRKTTRIAVDIFKKVLPDKELFEVPVNFRKTN